MAEHSANGKVFASMQILADNLTHDQARSLEGALIRKRLTANAGNYKFTDSVEEQLKQSGLLNKNRGRIPGRWTSENPLSDLEDKMFDRPKTVTCKG